MTTKYTADHEWINIEDHDAAVVGITLHAQDALGDVVFVDLPEVGRTLKQGEPFGTIESVKAVSELYAPVSGEVIQVNTSLTEKPEAVNKDPHNAWMIAVKVDDPGEATDLFDSAKYAELTK